MNNFVILVLDEDYDAVLRLLLSVSAIAVPLFLAFIVLRFILFRQQQFTKVQPLGELQDDFVYIARPYPHLLQTYSL